jgi:hypothetical protein
MKYDKLPKDVQRELEARAFRSLVKHLADRPEVANMDLMTLSGKKRMDLRLLTVMDVRTELTQGL